MSLIHISDKWTSVRRTKQSLKQSSTRCHDTPSAGLVLEVNLLWQEVKYCGDEKWWHYITGHFLLRYSYRVLQSHQGSLVYFRANNRAHTRTPGVQPLEAPETSCSGVVVTEPPSREDTPVCGLFFVVSCMLVKCGMFCCSCLEWFKWDYYMQNVTNMSIFKSWWHWGSLRPVSSNY